MCKKKAIFSSLYRLINKTLLFFFFLSLNNLIKKWTTIIELWRLNWCPGYPWMPICRTPADDCKCFKWTETYRVVAVNPIINLVVTTLLSLLSIKFPSIITDWVEQTVRTRLTSGRKVIKVDLITSSFSFWGTWSIRYWIFNLQIPKWVTSLLDGNFERLNKNQRNLLYRIDFQDPYIRYKDTLITTIIHREKVQFCCNDLFLPEIQSVSKKWEIKFERGSISELV